MTPDEHIVVRVTEDGKSYVWWTINRPAVLPAEPLQAIGNRTTSSSTLGTAVGAALPALST